MAIKALLTFLAAGFITCVFMSGYTLGFAHGWGDGSLFTIRALRPEAPK